MQDNERQEQVYLTLRQFTERHKFMSLNAIRQLIYTNKDFCQACVRKLGKKILLNEKLALEYIEKTRRD